MASNWQFGNYESDPPDPREYLDYDDADENGDDPPTCWACNGSGEGPADGTRCSRCGGRGE